MFAHDTTSAPLQASSARVRRSLNAEFSEAARSAQ